MDDAGTEKIFEDSVKGLLARGSFTPRSRP